MPGRQTHNPTLPLASTSSPPGWLAPVAILLLANLLAYAPAYSAGFVWDDPDYIVNNANLRTIQGLFDTWLVPRSLPQYYPLVHTTFWFEYQLWGLWSPGYHTVNILLHALGSLLVWRVLLRLDFPGPAALLGALAWSLHPVQVESVAWVTERKNTLSLIFYLLAGLCLLRVLGEQPRRWFWYGAALCLFLMALASKTVTASLPAAYLLIVYWKRGTITRRDVLITAPFFVVGAAAGLLTGYLERTHVGAVGPEWDFSLAERGLIAGRAVWFYVSSLVWPFGLSFIYPRWEISASSLLQWAAPLGAVGGLLGLFVMRRRIGRGPFVAAAFFVGTLFPALGFVNVYPHRYSFVADHFQHIASIAPLALLGLLLARFPKPVSVVLLGFLAVLTLAQARTYKDALTLWTDTLKHNPQGWMVHVNLGLTHAELAKKATSQAARSYHERQAYDAMLNSQRFGPAVPETHWNAGVAHANRDEFTAAREAFESALKIDPAYVPALNSYGLVLLRQGELPAAREKLERAVRLQPRFPAAQANLAETLARQGEFEPAARHYGAALELRPEQTQWRIALARHLVRWSDATENPLLKRQYLDYAAGHFNQALARTAPPYDFTVLNEFADVLTRLGRPLEAEAVRKRR